MLTEPELPAPIPTRQSGDSLPPNSAERSTRWKVFETLASTNDSIHEAASSGAPEGTVHIALRQTRGRGRAGHVWWSPSGAGLWMTVLLRPRLSPDAVAAIALLAGKATRQALTPLVRQPIELYWPNDLYVGRRKLGGILGEMRNSAAGFWIALGVGINICLDPATVPEELDGQVVDLAEIGCSERDPLPLASRITDALFHEYDRLHAGEPLSALLVDDLAHVGSRVSVRQEGQPDLEGTAIGVGDGGELLVRSHEGEIHRVLAGDVTYHGDSEC